MLWFSLCEMPILMASIDPQSRHNSQSNRQVDIGLLLLELHAIFIELTKDQIEFDNNFARAARLKFVTGKGRAIRVIYNIKPGAGVGPYRSTPEKSRSVLLSAAPPPPKRSLMLCHQPFGAIFQVFISKRCGPGVEGICTKP